MAHQSRPGKADFTSTLGHARELGRLLGRRVDWVDDVCGEQAMAAIESLEPGQVLMLNNVRGHEEETSVKGNHAITGQTQLVERLSSVVDLYVNDAFACAHRASPSMTGFAHHLPCLTGVLMQNEIEALNRALHEPAPPGGAWRHQGGRFHPGRGQHAPPARPMKCGSPAASPT